MTMVSTGPISLGGNATTGGLNQSVNIELGRAATATINMNESAVRTLAGVPSGAISMNNFYGKANQFAFTISSNQTNANLRTLAVSAGWNQSSSVVATISSGVIISSDSTGTPALTIAGSFPGGVELRNSGVIVGMGGNGGRAASLFQASVTVSPTAGGAGGIALSVSVASSINNTGTIAGGGGGGGGGESIAFNGNYGWEVYGGGGGGGGRSSAVANTSGGSGGAASGGASGGAFNYSGAGGGGGSYAGAGGGGFGGNFPSPNSGSPAGAGGAGGGWGASGANGVAVAGYSITSATSGGSGGAAVSGNSNITWLATGTRFGALT